MVTDVTPDSVGLSWTVPKGEFDSFLVQYKDRDGQPQVVPVATDQREVTIPGCKCSAKAAAFAESSSGHREKGAEIFHFPMGAIYPH